MEDGLKSCGGLWLKDGKKGKYFSGEIEIDEVKTHILIFKNDKGDNPKRPDYRIYIPGEESISPQKKESFDDDVPF